MRMLRTTLALATAATLFTACGHVPVLEPAADPVAGHPWLAADPAPAPAAAQPDRLTAYLPSIPTRFTYRKTAMAQKDGSQARLAAIIEVRPVHPDDRDAPCRITRWARQSGTSLEHWTVRPDSEGGYAVTVEPRATARDGRYAEADDIRWRDDPLPDPQSRHDLWEYFERDGPEGVRLKAEMPLLLRSGCEVKLNQGDDRPPAWSVAATPADDPVSTPAGVFRDCLRVTLNVPASGDELGWETTSWWARGKGLVKELQDQAGTPVYRLELLQSGRAPAEDKKIPE